MNNFVTNQESSKVLHQGQNNENFFQGSYYGVNNHISGFKSPIKNNPLQQPVNQFTNRMSYKWESASLRSPVVNPLEKSVKYNQQINQFRLQNVNP